MFPENFYVNETASTGSNQKAYLCSMKNLLVLSIEAALRAGEAVMQVYNTSFEVFVKEDQSPVTQADLKASDIIKQTLTETGLPFVSEEDLPPDRSSFGKYWLVDPLDGTMEFVKRNGEFTVNIALIDDKRPVLGVIYAPVTDTLWYADEKGAYKRENPDVEQLKSNFPAWKNQSLLLPFSLRLRPFTVLVSRSHQTQEVINYIEDKLRPLHPELVLDSCGSSLKFARLAEGSADVYVCYSKTKEWDTAAAEAILRATGGKVCCISDGQPLEYSKKDYPNPPFTAWKGK